ncbi:MAG TPA: signal peptidase II [bacterium]|nr:signal peptidase II [bacterium]
MTISNKEKAKTLAVITPLVFLLDQASKWLIRQNLALGDIHHVLTGLFDIVHVRNRGAAFGFMAGLPESVRLPFFFIVSFLALGLITAYFFRMKDGRRSVAVCLALILGGALGNIWDRLTLGEVVDFLSFHWYDRIANFRVAGWVLRFRLEWPAFNVADMAISIAVAWLMILMLKPPKEGN